MGDSEEPNGLIITVGLQYEPVLYSLQQVNPNFVAFICTPVSTATLDKVGEKFSLPHSHIWRREIPDEPAQIGRLVHEFYAAFLWLRDEHHIAPSRIHSDPTAGRKWMSAGATMIASFLGLNMFYTDAQFINGVPDPATMRFVRLGNAYDQTGFLQLERARDLFNRFEFATAAKLFSELKPTLSQQADLFAGLAVLAQGLHRWELFEHYSSSLQEEFERAFNQLHRVVYSGIAPPAFIECFEGAKCLADAIHKVTVSPKPALEAVVDLIHNGLRRMDQGRYDDAVARFYRALEAMCQFYLNKHGIRSSTSPDYGKLSQSARQAAEQALEGQLPQHIGLNDGWRMLQSWGEPTAGLIFKQSKGKLHNVFQGALEKRNGSIMAHGWTPIGKDQAETMAGRMRELIGQIEGGIFNDLSTRLQVPHLPSFWSGNEL